MAEKQVVTGLQVSAGTTWQAPDSVQKVRDEQS